MKIFNIGFPELFLFLILALIVLGPERIVENARALGGLIRKARNNPTLNEIIHTSKEIRDLPRKIVEESGLEDSIKEINQATQSMGRDFHIDSLEGKIEITPPPEPFLQMDPPQKSP